jgi:hypothetical protein
MKSTCFHCRFVGVAATGSRCPRCSYPLIANMTGAKLATRDLQWIFQHNAPAAQHKAPPLPGVNAEPRQAQLLMAKRRAKALARLEERRQQEAAERRQEVAAQASLRRRARLRTFASLFAASAAVALGLLLTLDLMGAL